MMESLSPGPSVTMALGGPSPVHRSCNNTPQRHYFNAGGGGEDDIMYFGGPPPPVPGSGKQSVPNLSLEESRDLTAVMMSHGVLVNRVTPRLFTPSGGPRTSNSTPSVHSSVSSARKGRHHRRRGQSPQVSSSVFNTSNEGGGGRSSSITPPNSNSNTTISCGSSGNSTSAHLGVPLATAVENLKNSRMVTTTSPKKSILEEEDDSIRSDLSYNNNKTRVRTSWASSSSSQEFLPICDALFNLISLIVYFGDVVFDLLTAYTWYRISQDAASALELDSFASEEEEERAVRSSRLWIWSVVALSFIFLSNLTCQILSFAWLKGRRVSLLLVHTLFLSVLYRYFKLFVPVDPASVKVQVRDLCVLRVVHALTEAVPMLLLQLYLIWGASSSLAISNFTIVSSSLSLFSAAWALASFNKYIDKASLHKFQLTWMGVILQLLWHLGTLTSRVLSLSLYASVYGAWVLLVLTLHWASMFLWLLLSNDDKKRKVLSSSIVALIYTFCYVNVDKKQSKSSTTKKVKVLIYYVTMFLENSLLFSLWVLARRYEDHVWFRDKVTLTTFASFFAGLFFMLVYYRFFHLRRLSYFSKGDKSCLEINNSSYLNNNNVSKVGLVKEEATPGIFHCAMNMNMARKKKKPTSFVPPPCTVVPKKMSHPFWRKPPSSSSNTPSENNDRVVDIAQKLQEKKEQQLAELREIEEEIKCGKLERPQHPHPDPVKPPLSRFPSSNGDQIILDPHAYLSLMSNYAYAAEDNNEEEDCNNCYLYYGHYDDPDRSHYHHHHHNQVPQHYYEPEPMYQNQSHSHSHHHHEEGSSPSKGKSKASEGLYKSVRIPSDVSLVSESQFNSLPRSYTLPREFKYKRKFVRGKVKTDQFTVPSTNSSDGDVDSGEEAGGPDIYGTLGGPYPLPLPIPHIYPHQSQNGISPQPGKLKSRKPKECHETKM